MEVIQAKSAGFCFGVARAVKMAQELVRTAECPRMLGSVIHNPWDRGPDDPFFGTPVD